MADQSPPTTPASVGVFDAHADIDISQKIRDLLKGSASDANGIALAGDGLVLALQQPASPKRISLINRLPTELGGDWEHGCIIHTDLGAMRIVYDKSRHASSHDAASAAWKMVDAHNATLISEEPAHSPSGTAAGPDLGADEAKDNAPFLSGWFVRVRCY